LGLLHLRHVPAAAVLPQHPEGARASSLVDGANRLRILWQIVVPIVRPAVAVLAVFTFINYWSSFLCPLIITNSADKFTVPVGLNGFLGQQGNQWHLLMAAATISMLPTVLVVLLQRHLVRGIAMSGLAGR
jgi:multiple sugar transport system permease protein